MKITVEVEVADHYMGRTGENELGMAIQDVASNFAFVNSVEFKVPGRETQKMTYV